MAIYRVNGVLCIIYEDISLKRAYISNLKHIHMRSIAVLALSLLVVSGAFGQTRVVKGKLTTFNKYPVMNVTVESKKAGSTVTTDSLGQFELVCNEKDKTCVLNGIRLSSGDYISINGHEGSVYKGLIKVTA